MEESLGLSKKSFGTETDTDTQSWFQLPDTETMFRSYTTLSIIITWARLQPASGKLDTVNCVRFLYIGRALGHLI